VVIAFLAGVGYASIAIPAQTELQAEIPQAVRGRVFGILNMLVSVGSFLPIIVVGPISDVVGTMPVVLFAASSIVIVGVASLVRRRDVALGTTTPEAVAAGGPAVDTRPVAAPEAATMAGPVVSAAPIAGVRRRALPASRPTRRGPAGRHDALRIAARPVRRRAVCSRPAFAVGSPEARSA